MTQRSISRFMIVIAAIVLSAFALVTLSACGPSDEERISTVLTTEFDKVKNHDDAYVASMLDDNAKQALTSVGIDSEAFTSAFLDGFDYRIDSINVEKDTATAEVTITSKSLNSITSALQDDAQASAAAGTGSNLSEEQIQQQISEQALEYANDAQPQEKPTITVTLHRSGSTWSADSQIRSAIEQAFA